MPLIHFGEDMAIEFKKSTAARDDFERFHGISDVMLGAPPKPKVGRPSTGFDRNAYQRDYMADQRKASKLGMTVSEYRKGSRDGNDN